MKLPYKNKMLIKTVALFLAANLIFVNSYSQATEKKPVTVQLSFYKNSDENRTVAAIASTKNDSGKLVFVPGIKINFYVLQSTGESLLASAFTDEGGKAVVQLPKNIAIDTSGLTITARIENDKEYANAEATGVVKDARLVLSISEADSSKIIKAVVTEIQLSGEEKPLAGVEVNFGIHRAFGIMPLSGEATVTTDENGMATFTFPKNINGDENGNVILKTSITDNELYGNIEAAAKAKWGTPLVVDKNPFPRALWEPNAPILLMVVFSIIFGGIWFTYSLVIYRIAKIEKRTTA